MSLERKPALDTLVISELRYRRLFEAARDGILIVDSEHGKITDANPFMTELLGYSHDELLGKELWEIGLLKDEQASREAFSATEDAWLHSLRGLTARKPWLPYWT
jgi:PAS domain S-box-containing protein